MLRISVAAWALHGQALAQAAPMDARSASVAALSEAAQLAASGNMADACAKYAQSYSLDAQLDALLPLAGCFEQSGKLASAYLAFRDAVEVAQRSGDNRAATAEERAKRLRPRLSYLTIEVLQDRRLPALSVERDGFRLGSSAWGVPVPVDPGQHVISASAYGYKPWQTSIHVQGEGAAPYVEVPLLESSDAPAPVSAVSAAPVPPVAAPPAPRSVATPPPSRAAAGRGLTPPRIAAIAAAGVGVVSLGVGAYFTAKTRSTLDERDGICPSGKDCAPGTNAHLADLTSDAKGQQRAGITFFALGGAALALGAGLWFLPKVNASKDHSTYLVPLVQPAGGGLLLGGRL